MPKRSKYEVFAWHGIGLAVLAASVIYSTGADVSIFALLSLMYAEQIRQGMD